MLILTILHNTFNKNDFIVFVAIGDFFLVWERGGVLIYHVVYQCLGFGGGGGITNVLVLHMVLAFCLAFLMH